MPGEITKIEDVVVPEIFTAYMIKKTAELSNIIRSGLATPNPLLNQLVSGGGTTINMPFWQDLKGKSQVMSQSREINPKKIVAGKEIGVLLIRAAAWGTHELAGAFAGSDPLGAIYELVGDWWVRDEQTTLISILNGAFASPSMEDLVHDKPTTSISAELVLDAKQLLGDNAGKLVAMAMHSFVFTELQKQNLIEYIPNARGEMDIPTYLKYRVIVDDEMPVDISGANPVFSTYLFQQGVIGRGEGIPVSVTPTEIQRNGLGSTTYLIHRRALILHPAGMEWIGRQADPQDDTPSNTDLARADSWNRVFEQKQMGMVKLIHTL